MVIGLSITCNAISAWLISPSSRITNMTASVRTRRFDENDQQRQDTEHRDDDQSWRRQEPVAAGCRHLGTGRHVHGFRYCSSHRLILQNLGRICADLDADRHAGLEFILGAMTVLLADD